MHDLAIDPPVVVVATEEEWASRSLESVLVNHGYVVIRALDGREALSAARSAQPDAVLLDEHLALVGGIDVCAQLRADTSVDAATPIIIMASAPAPHGVRLAAFAAGAWDFCTHPIDTELLLLELSTFIRARRVVLAESRAGLDGSVGVVSARGMKVWAEHVAARAARNHESLACIVLMPGTDEAVSREDVGAASVASFVQLAREYFRRSDVVGRLPDGRLALLAPDTDAVGVRGLVARLRNALEEAATSGTTTIESANFRAGYWAVKDFASAPLQATELLQRAAQALDHVNLHPGDSLTIGFEQLPIT